MSNYKASIKTVEETDYQQKINAIGRGGEEINERSMFGLVGFHSTPKEDDIGVIVESDDNIAMVATSDNVDDRPDDIENTTTIYRNKDSYVKITDSGEIIVANSQNKIILKSSGDIELGEGTLKKLVTETVLSTLAAHANPVAGALASASLDPAMIILATDPVNKTTKTKAL